MNLDKQRIPAARWGIGAWARGQYTGLEAQTTALKKNQLGGQLESVLLLDKRFAKTALGWYLCSHGNGPTPNIGLRRWALSAKSDRRQNYGSAQTAGWRIGPVPAEFVC